MKNNRISTLIKGTIVGGTMLVPGVSGGSMAMILGIYDKLISSVSSFFKNKKDNFFFLSLFSLGGLLGMILFANPILYLIQKYPMPMIYFFLGAVAGGIPLICRQAKIEGYSFKLIVYIIFGMVLVLGFSLLPSGAFETETGVGSPNTILLVLSGIVAAVALVLPGISVSYLFLLMGLYDQLMWAVSQSYFPFLIPLGAGLILGILLSAKILERAMTRYPQPTYLIILGFVIGSMAEVFPGVPNSSQLFLCLFCFAAGFIIIRLLSLNEVKNMAEERAVSEPDSKSGMK